MTPLPPCYWTKSHFFQFFYGSSNSSYKWTCETKGQINLPWWWGWCWGGGCRFCGRLWGLLGGRRLLLQGQLLLLRAVKVVEVWLSGYLLGLPVLLPLLRGQGLTHRAWVQNISGNIKWICETYDFLLNPPLIFGFIKHLK